MTAMRRQLRAPCRTPNPTRADRFSSRKTVQYWGL
jgi:hypothetical protein